jgi:hypothetical protein
LNLLVLGVVVVSLLKIVSYVHTMRNIRFIVKRISEVDGKKVPITEFFKDTEISERVFYIENEKNLEVLRH